MAKGVKVAKPGYGIGASTDHLYVDTDNPLLKVHLYGSGSYVMSGTSTTPVFRGKYPGVAVGGSVQFTIPHNLGYTPMFLAYMDFGNVSDRRYLTNITSGSTGNTAFASIDANNLTIYATPYTIGGQPYPVAGEYGFFFYIFKDRITPKGVQPKL